MATTVAATSNCKCISLLTLTHQLANSPSGFCVNTQLGQASRSVGCKHSNAQPVLACCWFVLVEQKGKEVGRPSLDPLHTLFIEGN